MTSPPGRRARASGWAVQASTRSARPAITPAWGPPNNLSPEKVTRSAPASRLWTAPGSSVSQDGGPSASHGQPASNRPEPRSATTGTPRPAISATPTASVNPMIRKLDRWTFKARATSPLATTASKSD